MSDKKPWEEVYASPESKASDNSNKMPWEEAYASPASETRDESVPSTSAGGAFVHEAARSAVPGVAGILGGAGAGALAGLAGGPLAPITVPLAALGGAIGVGMGARKLQDVVADEYAPDSFMGTKQAQREAEEHPLASFGGGLVGMGKPSASALSGGLKALGTAAGREGISTVAKAIAKKGGVKALQEAAEMGGAEGEAAKQALEHFGHGLGAIAGVGTQAGMGIAEGEDPLTATAKGVAGLAVKPWVGPGGVFLDPLKAKGGAESGTTSTKTEKPATEETETTLSPEERAALDAAKSKSTEVTTPPVTPESVTEGTSAGNTVAAETDQKAKVDAITETVAQNLEQSDAPATAQALREGAIQSGTETVSDENKTPSQQQGTEADQTGQDVTAGGENSSAAEVTAGQPEVVEPPLSSPGAEAQQAASGVGDLPAASQTENQPANEIQVQNQPVTESPATPTPEAQQPTVDQTSVLPEVRDGERTIDSADYKSPDRILGQLEKDTAKSPSIKTQAVQAEQAGDTAKLNALLFEARIRERNSAPKNRPKAARMAEEIRQRIARVQNGESMPAEQPASTQAEAQPTMTVDDLDSLGDLLLGGGDGSEILAKSAATKSTEKEDPRGSLRRMLGLAAKGAGLIKNGAKDFETWSKQMASFGETDAAKLKDIWDYSNEYLQNPALAKQDLAHIEQWTSDPKEQELRLLEGKRVVIPRMVDMDDPSQFSQKLGFEFDPETREMVVKPKNFDPIIEARGIKPKGENGQFSYQQIANFLNKYFKKEGVKTRMDKSTVGKHIAREENAMPTDRLENALKWYKLNVENKTTADKIYEQNPPLSPSDLMNEGAKTLDVIRQSLPTDKKGEFEQLYTKVDNYLTTQLGGTIHRKLTSAEELARREANKRKGADADLEAMERQQLAQENAERKGRYEEPVLPNAGKSRGEAPIEDEDYELYEKPEGKAGKDVSSRREYFPNKNYSGYTEDEREAMRYFTLATTMGKVAAELRGEPNQNIIKRLQVRGLDSVVGNDDLRQAKAEIKKIQERQREGGTETRSMNAKTNDSQAEFGDFLADSGQAAEDSDETFKPTEQRGLGEKEELTPEELNENTRQRAFARLEANDLSLQDRLSVIFGLVKQGVLTPEEMGRFAEEIRNIPAKESERALENANRLINRYKFSVDEILDGVHKTQELGARASRLAEIQTEGEVPLDPHEFLRDYAEQLYPGVEFHPDPDMNENLSEGTPVGAMEAYISRKTGRIGVRYDPAALEGQIRGMDEQQAQAYMLKAMDEEVLHLSGWVDENGRVDEDAMDHAEDLGNKMSEGQKRRVARFYLGYGASKKQVEAIMDNPFLLGSEYARMMHQMMRTGKSTEVLREAQANPDLLTTLMDYIGNAMRYIKARLAYHLDPMLKRQLDFMSQNYDLLSSGLMNLVSDPAKYPVSLKAALSKTKRLGLEENATARLFVERNEKKIDWNKVKTPEQLAEYTARNQQETASKVPLTTDDMYDIMMREAKVHRFLPGQGGDAARKFLATDESLRRRACEKKAAELTEERQKNFSEWQNYLERENPEYAKDPFWKALSYEMLYNALASDRGRGLGETLPLNRGVLAQLRSEVENLPKNQNLDLLKMYRKQLAEYARTNTADEVALSGDKKWVYIPSKTEDPNNFAENVDKLKSLSHEGWCTRTYNAEPYLKEGGFWILTHGDSPAAAVRMLDGGDIAEIQGRKNNGTIPEEYGQDIKSLLEARKDKLRNYWKFEIKNPATSKERFLEILKQERPEDLSQAITTVKDSSTRQFIFDQNRPELDWGLTFGRFFMPHFAPVEMQVQILERANQRLKQGSSSKFDLEIIDAYRPSHFYNPERVNQKLSEIAETVYNNALKTNDADKQRNLIKAAEGLYKDILKQKNLNSETKEVLTKAAEKLGFDPESVKPEKPKFWSSEDEDPDELIAYSPATKTKTSTSQINDDLPKGEKIPYREWTYEDASSSANRAFDNASNKQSLYDNLFSAVDNTDPVVKLHLAYKFRSQFQKTIAELENKKASGSKLSLDEMLVLNDAKDRKEAVDNLLVGLSSKGAQVTRHSALLRENPTGLNTQAYIKAFLGRTPEDIANDKGFNLRDFYQGLRGIKQKVAQLTIDAASDFLDRAGISDPKDKAKLAGILAHPDTTFADIENVVGTLLPESNAAKTRALSEQIYRLYSNATDEVAGTDLAKVIANALNGTTLRGSGDEFIKKLSKFLKLGKFDEDEITDTVLKTLGVTGFDAEFIKQIRKDVDRLPTLPEGELRNRASLDILQKVRRRFYAQVLKDWNNPANREHLWNIVTSAWQAGVLSGPPTMGVNLLGSAASVAVESFMDASGYALKTGDARYLADVMKGFISAIAGTKGGISSAAINEFTSAMKGEGTKYRNSMMEEAPHLENIDSEQLTGAMRALAVHADRLKWVGRVMTAMDAVNMTAADEAQQRMAIRYFLSQKKGLPAGDIRDIMQRAFDPDKVEVESLRKRAESEVAAAMPDKTDADKARWVKRRIGELLSLEREKILQGVTTQSRAAAEHYTYNDDATGFIGKYVVGLSSSINKNTPAAKFIFSFMNTLANIMNQTLDYTPYGFLRAANKTGSQKNFKRTDRFAPRLFEEGSPEQIAEMVRATLGTAALMTITYLAYKGYEDESNGRDPYFTVTGAGPKDPADREQLVETRGWQPNSIKIGNMWYRYMDMPVLGIPLGAIGTLFDTLRYKKDEQTAMETAQAMAISAVTTIFDKNLLQGANNLFNTLQGSSTQSQVNALGRLTGGAISGFTNPGLARWARSTFAMDGDGQVTRQDQSGLQGWLYSLVPFSAGYNTPALNTLGEPIKQPWYTATTRRLNDFSNIPPHPIITPLVQAGLMLPNPSRGTEFRYIDPATTEVKKSKTGKYPEIMRRYVELRGQAMKEILTPDMIQALQEMASQDKNVAQQYLDSKIGGAARNYAVKQIEVELMDGKLKI